MLGQNPRLLSSGRQGPDFYAALWQHLEQAGHWSGEIWNQRKNGETCAELITISRVLDAQGQAHMVDVGAKPATHRTAVASGRIQMQPATLALIESGSAKKGDVLGVARIAAIMAAKKTSELIPLCHPLALTRVAVEFELDETASSVTCTVRAECEGRTGVEMEALTAVQVGLLTIYDMLKAADRGMVIEDVRLLEKHGGKSGSFVAKEPGNAR